jgi:hypothetical protein
VTNPELGYVYHEDTYTKNQDRIQMLIYYRTLSLNGYHLSDPDEDSALPSGHYLQYPETYIWPKEYLFDYWVQQAQKRDDYNPSANSLNDTTWNTVRDYLELVLTAKIDAHVLWTLVHSTSRSPAMQSCASALMQYRRRIQQCVANLNSVTYPAGFEPIIQYWQKVFTPSETGPLVVNLFLFGLLNTDHSSGYNTFESGSMPKLNNATDVGKLVVNIERAIEELRGVNLSTADRRTDLKVVKYHMNMVGVGEPQTKAMPADVDTQRWEEQLVRESISLYDSVGARMLTTNVVANDDVDAQLYQQRSVGFSPEYWKGIGPVYAHMSESNDYSFTIAGQWCLPWELHRAFSRMMLLLIPDVWFGFILMKMVGYMAQIILIYLLQLVVRLCSGSVLILVSTISSRN